MNLPVKPVYDLDQLSVAMNNAKKQADEYQSVIDAADRQALWVSPKDLTGIERTDAEKSRDYQDPIFKGSKWAWLDDGGIPNDKLTNAMIKANGGMTLGDMFQDKRVFEAVPALAGVEVKVVPEGSLGKNVYGQFKNGTIYTTTKPGTPEFLQNIRHEAQHGIQVQLGASDKWYDKGKLRAPDYDRKEKTMKAYAARPWESQARMAADLQAIDDDAKYKDRIVPPRGVENMGNADLDKFHLKGLFNSERLRY